MKNILLTTKGQLLFVFSIFYPLFLLFNRAGFNRGFDYYSFSRTAYSLINGLGYTDLYDPHSHFPPLMSIYYSIARIITQTPDPLLLFSQALLYSLFIVFTFRQLKAISQSTLMALTLSCFFAFSKYFIIISSGFTSESIYHLLVLLAVSPFIVNRTEKKYFLYSSILFSLAFLCKQIAIYHFALFFILLLFKEKKRVLYFLIPFGTTVGLWILRNYLLYLPLSGRSSGAGDFARFNFHRIPVTTLQIIFHIEPSEASQIIPVFYALLILLVLIVVGAINAIKSNNRKFSVVDKWHIISAVGYIPFILCSFTFFDAVIKYDERLAFPLHWHFLFITAALYATVNESLKQSQHWQNIAVGSCLLVLAFQLNNGTKAIISHIKFVPTDAYQLIKKTPLARNALQLTQGRPLIFTNIFPYAVNILPINTFIIDTNFTAPNDVSKSFERFCHDRPCFRLEFYQQGRFDYLPPREAYSWDRLARKELIFFDATGKLERLTPLD